MWCTSDNHNNSYVQKNFLDSNFNQGVIYKISTFKEITPNSTYSQTSYFLKYKWNL